MCTHLFFPVPNHWMERELIHACDGYDTWYCERSNKTESEIQEHRVRWLVRAVCCKLDGQTHRWPVEAIPTHWL